METLVEFKLPQCVLDVHTVLSRMGLCSLKQLTIFGNPLFISKFLGIIRPGLHHITIKICVQSSMSLRSIGLDMGCLDKGQGFVILEPMLAPAQLEDCRIVAPNANLSLADIRWMAASWPYLRRLTLAIQISDGATPNMQSHLETTSIKCLLHFAKLCPKFDVLGIELQDQELPSAVCFPLLSHPL
jgi:hypothetical protein